MRQLGVLVHCLQQLVQMTLGLQVLLLELLLVVVVR